MITVNFDILNLKSGYKILDMGCGTGRHLAAINYISTVNNIKDVTVIGSDVSLDNLIEAKKRMDLQNILLKETEKNCNLLLSDIINLPFSENSFDLIICSEVLEHIQNDKRAIKELVRILKPGKTLAISVPRYWPEKICWSLSKTYANSGKNHIRIYRKKTLINLLKSYGLSCYYTHYSHSLHTPFWILKCMTDFKSREPYFLSLYYKLLVWDIMKKPFITRILDSVLNPILGKSLVIYTRKD